MVVRIKMKYKILFFFSIFIFSSNLNAKDIYLSCESIIDNIRADGGYLIEGNDGGKILVKIKNSKAEAFYILEEDGYQISFNEKIKKNKLGFSYSINWDDKEFKNSEEFNFIKPVDDYIYKRSSYFWAKSDGKETITDFDSSGRCKFVEKKYYIQTTKNIR